MDNCPSQIGDRRDRGDRKSRGETWEPEWQPWVTSRVGVWAYLSLRIYVSCQDSCVSRVGQLGVGDRLLGTWKVPGGLSLRGSPVRGAERVSVVSLFGVLGIVEGTQVLVCLPYVPSLSIL